MKKTELEILKNTLEEIKDQLKSCIVQPKPDPEDKMKKEAKKKFERYLKLADERGQIVLDVGIKNKATGEMNYYCCGAIPLVRPIQKKNCKGKFIAIKYGATICKRQQNPGVFHDLLI